MTIAIHPSLQPLVRGELHRLRGDCTPQGVQLFISSILRATWQGGYVTEEFIDKKTRHVATMLAGISEQAVLDTFFQTTLPELIDAILAAMQTFQIKQLRSCSAGENTRQTVELTGEQCRLAVGLALLCVPLSQKDDKALLRETTFCDAFKNSEKQVQKLECILRYLNRREAADTPRFPIRVTRLAGGFRGSEFWLSRHAENLVDFVCEDEGCIEDKHHALQADFANRYVGGGVLGLGCVQEEIRFIIAPELIAASFVCLDPMQDNEAVIIENTRQFVRYTGYANSFECDGDVQDLIADTVVCIDAIPFQTSKLSETSTGQYSHQAILRELNKVMVGLQHDILPHQPFATGNWGCGVFNGDPQLKAVIQWIAASAAGRPLVYHTFSDPRILKLGSFVQVLSQRDVTPGQLFQWLLEMTMTPHVAITPGVFQYILSKLPVTPSYTQ